MEVHREHLKFNKFAGIKSFYVTFKNCFVLKLFFFFFSFGTAFLQDRFH